MTIDIERAREIAKGPHYHDVDCDGNLPCRTDLARAYVAAAEARDRMPPDEMHFVNVAECEHLGKRWDCAITQCPLCERAALRAEVERLQDAADQVERDAWKHIHARDAEIERLREEVARLKKALADAQGHTREFDAEEFKKDETIARLRRERDDAREQLHDCRGFLADVRKELGGQDHDYAPGLAHDRMAELRAAEARVSELEAALWGLFEVEAGGPMYPGRWVVRLARRVVSVQLTEKRARQQATRMQTAIKRALARADEREACIADVAANGTPENAPVIIAAIRARGEA